MTGESGDLVGHFRAGVDVVRRYPILIAPPLAVQVIVFVLALLFLGGGFGIGMLLGGAMGGMPAGAAGGVVGMMAGGLLLMVLSGFLSEGGDAHGRPVGVAIDRRGALLVADDVGNTVWRVTARSGGSAR